MMLIDTAATSSVTGAGFDSDRTPLRQAVRPRPGVPHTVGRGRPVRTALVRRRPVGAPMPCRGTGVALSRAPHRPRPITPVTTVLLALVAAGITIWLGLVAQFGATLADAAPVVPDQLGVVRVQSGENLRHLAARVAPDAPTEAVVARIRELNSLETVALDAGQTLIAPIG